MPRWSPTSSYADRVTALVVTAEDAPGRWSSATLAPLRDRLDALTSDLTMAAAHRDDALAAPLRAALRARLGPVADQLVRRSPTSSATGGWC